MITQTKYIHKRVICINSYLFMIKQTKFKLISDIIKFITDHHQNIQSLHLSHYHLLKRTIPFIIYLLSKIFTTKK